MANLAVEVSADSVSAIEHTLSDLIRSSTSAAVEAPVVRARTLNLIVRGDSREQRDRAASILTSMAQVQPSRAVILASNDEPGPPGIQARVGTRCHQRGGKLLCYEQISIDTFGPSGDHVAGVVEPLLVSHLPTCLWWMGDPDFSQEAFHQLAAISDRLIVDSGCFTDLENDLAELLACLRREDLIVNDLNWQRLQPWREMVAQLFNGAQGLDHVMAVSGVDVRLSGAHRMQALLLLGWLSSRLNWFIGETGIANPGIGARAGHEITVRITEGPGAQSDLVRVELRTRLSDGEGRFEIERDDEQIAMVMSGPGLPELSRATRLRWPTDADLLQQGLSLRCHDAIFEQALHDSTRLLLLVEA